MALLPTKLSSLFGGRSHPLLGLDIGASSVRVVGLDRGMGGQLSLEHCASERLQPGWVTGDRVDKPGDVSQDKFDELAQVIKRVISKSGAKHKRVAMALPASAVVTRKLNIQADLSEGDFEAQVEAEINPYLPWASEESNFDFVVLGPVNGGAEIEVIAAATRREKVEERQSLAEAAGLKLVALDIEPYVRARMADFLGATAKGITAVFEIGSQATSLQVVKDGQVLFDRDLAFGGLQLTQMIERTYGLSPTEAERQKRSRDLPAGYESNAFAPYIANLAIEIERGLQFFHMSAGSQRVNNMVLAGGGACLTGLAKAVASQTGLPCQLANPFAQVTIKSEQLKKRLGRESASYLTACGLALRRFS